MSPGGLLILSGRRFVAEALADVFRGVPQVSSCAIVGDDTGVKDGLGALARWVIIDLDALPADIAILTSLLDGATTAPRRCGFYDTFNARDAEAAFALSITVLIPLTSSSERIVGAVLGDSGGLSVTEARGLTRRQLERLGSLTEREVEVLRHIAEGRPTKLIAHVLGITPHTVNTHKRRTFEKLDVQSQSQAVALAASAGIVATELT